MPYSNEYGLVEAELHALATDNHPLHRDDNAEVRHTLEGTTQCMK
jgi:hypothetical protein